MYPVPWCVELPRNTENTVRKLIPPLICAIIRLLGVTLRIRVQDRCGLTKGALTRPIIIIMWHNRISVAPYMYRRFCPKRREAVLTSPSKDGELLAGIMRGFDVGAVRGSSSRRGAVAIREMIAVLESGSDMTITPDGPRGPVYQFSPGALKLAQMTRASLMPYCIQYERYWELRTWDRFQIPKPFSRVNIVLGPLQEMAPPPPAAEGSAEAWFLAEKARIEGALAEALHTAGSFAKPPTAIPAELANK